jgi:hypothetical protein
MASWQMEISELLLARKGANNVQNGIIPSKGNQSTITKQDKNNNNIC